MSLEENKVIVRRFYEEMVGPGNDDLIDVLVAEDIDDYHPPGVPFLPGRAGFRKHIADIHRGVGNLQMVGE